MKLLIDAIGWSGAILVLTAYGLISLGRVDGKSYSYQVMNVVGAVCLMANCFWNHAIPSVVVNVVWIIIGILALRSSHKARKSDPKG